MKMRNHLNINNKPACGAWSSDILGNRQTVKLVKDKRYVDCNACKRTNAYKEKRLKDE